MTKSNRQASFTAGLVLVACALHVAAEPAPPLNTQPLPAGQRHTATPPHQPASSSSTAVRYDTLLDRQKQVETVAQARVQGLLTRQEQCAKWLNAGLIEKTTRAQFACILGAGPKVHQ
jgi:hypothetical protein